MKKIMLLTVALALVAGTSFAFELESGTSGKLLFGTSASGTTLAAEGIGISPKVVAKYATDGTDSITSQWYSIAAVHPGGNEAYGTAQNLNNILKKAYQSGADVATVLDTIPVDNASESFWTNAGWLVN